LELWSTASSHNAQGFDFAGIQRWK